MTTSLKITRKAGSKLTLLVRVLPSSWLVSGGRGDTEIRCALAMKPGPSLGSSVTFKIRQLLLIVLIMQRVLLLLTVRFVGTAITNCVVLNVDGSCLGSPIRAGYGGIIRNSAGFYLSGFSGYIPASTDILFAELSVMHRGLSMAVETGIEELVCYSDSMLAIKLITEQASNFHAYAVLIQDIKDLFST